MKGILFTLVLFFAITALSAKTFIREYTYNAGEADSKITSRAIALEQVKRLLLEEIGVYIHSTFQMETTEASNEVKELTTQQIEILSAGITETQIIEEKWDGETYYLKAEITVDENDVLKRLDKIIADKEKTKQLEKSRKRTDQALVAIERLRKELGKTQDEMEKLKLQKKYNQSSNELSAEDWFQKGIIAYGLEEFENSIFYWQKAININPDFAGAYNNMGVAYDEKGKYDIAIECFQKAINLKPDFAVAYNNMGVAYGKKGYYDKAMECYHKAININPDYAEAYNNIGVDYGEKGNYDKAIECYQKAININPDFAQVYCNMGVAYFEKGNYDKAIECYQKAININPDYEEAYYGMGFAYHEKGNDDKANEYMIKAARLGSKPAQNLLRELGISW